MVTARGAGILQVFALNRLKPQFPSLLNQES